MDALNPAAPHGLEDFRSAQAPALSRVERERVDCPCVWPPKGRWDGRCGDGRGGEAGGLPPQRDTSALESGLQKWCGPWTSLASLGVSGVCMCLKTGIDSGLVLLFIICVHEAGHFLAARWMRIPTGYPVFVPYVGAMVPVAPGRRSAFEEACLGISGLAAGICATLLVHALALRTGSALLLQGATGGYLIHAFNLIPAGSMDGGRIAALIGRWLWVPGAALLLGVRWMLGPYLSRVDRLLFWMLLLSALGRVVRVLLEWRGKVQPPPVGCERTGRIALTVLAATLFVVSGAGALQGVLHTLRAAP